MFVRIHTINESKFECTRHLFRKEQFVEEVRVMRFHVRFLFQRKVGDDYQEAGHRCRTLP